MSCREFDYGLGSLSNIRQFVNIPLRQQTLGHDKADDRIQAVPCLEIREYEGLILAHSASVAMHHSEGSADAGSQVCLVDDLQV